LSISEASCFTQCLTQCSLAYAPAKTCFGNEIKIIEIKEKKSSNENKEEMLKILNANMSISGVNLVPMMSKNKSVAISEIGLKTDIDVKIEKIVVKDKNIEREKIILLNVSINEINKVKIKTN